MRPGRFCLALVLASLCVVARSYCERTRNVFVLHMENSHVPANIAASSAIQEVLGREPRVQVFEEYLDESRLGTDFATMAAALGHKYAGQHIDLVLTIGPPALQFMLKYGEQLWPGVPKVFSAVDGKPTQLPPDVTGVYGFFRFAPTIDLALRLQPDIQHVFYIGGASTGEISRRNFAQSEFKPYAGRLDVTYLNDEPLPLILDHLSRLPSHSAVLFTTFFKDATGRTFITANVAPLVAVASNAPTYGTLETSIGSGIVGGSIFDFEKQARAGAVLGVKVLRGVPVANLPVQEGPRNDVIVDWRQLERWDIPMARVPAGTTVMFRELTVWERYRSYLWILLGVLVGQTALLALLLVQVRARKGANAAIRGLTRRLIHATEDERKRVAGELHDDIGQRLSLVSLQLDSAIADPAHDGNNAQDLKDCRLEVDTLITDVHNLSHQLHSSKLKHLGLESALKELCRSIGERHKLEVVLEAHGISPNLNPDISLCFYRVAQEGLNNVVRHSGANRAQVNVMATNGQLTMIVQDFGRGFQVGTSPPGLGLVTMEERLLTLSGTFSVSSRRGAGTTVMASAPLHSGAEDGEERDSRLEIAS